MKTRYAILVVILGLLIGAMIAYAIQNWQGSISWTVESKEFTVWDSLTGGAIIPTDFSDIIDVVPSGQVEIYDFYLQNDGTIPITIQITGETVLGASASWSNSGSWIIPVGTTRTQATLTLTITATGHYDWSFTLV